MNIILPAILSGLMWVGVAQHHHAVKQVNDLQSRGMVRLLTCVDKHCEFVDVAVLCKPTYKDCAEAILRERIK